MKQIKHFPTTGLVGDRTNIQKTIRQIERDTCERGKQGGAAPSGWGNPRGSCMEVTQG